LPYSPCHSFHLILMRNEGIKRISSRGKATGGGWPPPEPTTSEDMVVHCFPITLHHGPNEKKNHRYRIRDAAKRRRVIAANRGPRGLAYPEDRTIRGRAKTQLGFGMGPRMFPCRWWAAMTRSQGPDLNRSVCFICREERDRSPEKTTLISFEQIIPFNSGLP